MHASEAKSLLKSGSVLTQSHKADLLGLQLHLQKKYIKNMIIMILMLY